MLFLALTRSLLRTPARPRRCWPSYSTASKASDPLRILFCGSDEFSCVSLRALHEEQKRNANLIRSIDVVVRPSKPTGRGYKVLREVPLRALADQLKLPIHVRDTFTGWDMPKPDGEPINLIIAVSFGLFVPPRLINASKYGGLNVHPSLLPDLRGPAPLHHALLAEHTHTGITIQTLSPHAFDEGTILLQTPHPGTPIPPNSTLPQLHDLLARDGATMLIDALRLGLHVPPHQAQQQSYHHPQHQDSNNPATQLRHAPKIKPSDRQIHWTTTSAHAIALRARVLGPLWTHLLLSPRGGGGPEEKRVILEEMAVAEQPSPCHVDEELSSEVCRDGDGEGDGDGRSVVWIEKTGRELKEEDEEEGEGDVVGMEDGDKTATRLRYFTQDTVKDAGAVVVQMPDRSWLRIGRIKVEGMTSKPARRVLESVGVR